MKLPMSLSLAILTASLTSHAITCQERHIDFGRTSLYADWAAGQGPVLSTYSDGTSLYNPIAISGEQLGQNIVSLPTSNQLIMARMQTYLADVKRVMGEQIRGTSSEAELNGHQRFLLERLNGMNITYEYDQGCQNNAFNASYAQATNTLNVCPLLTRMPVEASLSLITHELGHLADPCNYIDDYQFSASLRRLQRDQRAQIRQLQSDIQRCLTGVPATQLREFIQWASGPNRLQAQAFTLYALDRGDRRANVERLAGCGVAVAPRILAPSKYEGSPYLSLISCVSGKYPLAGTPTPINASSDIGAGNVCDARNPQVKETVADYIGVSLVNYALNHSVIIPNDRTPLIGLFYNSVHYDERGDVNQDYAPSDVRLRALLQTPVVQSALGCTGEALPRECSVPTSLQR